MAARLSSFASLSLLVLVAPTVAFADGKDKFQHDPRVSLEIKQTDRSKPPPKKDDVPAPTPVDPLEVAALMGTIHEEQIAVLDDLVKQTPDSDAQDKADLLFRLGEIHAKLHRLHRLEATKADLEMGRATKPADKARLATEKEAHAKRAKQALLDAVKTYTMLVDNPAFAQFPQTADAVFFLAYTLQSGGYVTQARTNYDKLLKNYPKSRYVPEAHLAFADYFYDSNQLADAQARYRKVLEFPNSSIYWYAKYKLGWVSFNLRDHQDALEQFLAVAQGTARLPDKIVLHRAARKDFVRAYAEIGRADKALLAFRRIDQQKPYELLEMLGDLYSSQGKNDKAIAVYRQLLVEQPTSANTCLWQGNVARAMMTLGTQTERVAEIENLSKLYRVVSSKLPKAEADECRDVTAEMTGQIARMYHQEAVKTKQSETFALSDRLYRAYLSAFPTSADAADTRYFRAELLWSRAELEKNARLAMQEWGDAADAFAVALDGGGLDAKRIPIAADAAMIARLRALAIDPTKRAPAVTEASYATIPTPKALPEQEQKLLVALDLYLKYVKDPGNDERTDVLFTKAALLRRFDHLAESTPIFEEIVTKSPKFEGAETAAQLALDNLNRLRDYTAMLALADRLAANKAFMADKPELDKTVATLRRQSMRKDAEETEKAAQKSKDNDMFVACAQKFVAIYNMDALADDGDELLYNAGVCFEEGHSQAASANLYQVLQKNYPKSKLAAKSLARLGNVYAQTAFYKESAEKLEEYAAKYAGEDDAYRALSDAVLYRKGTGDDPKAIADTKLFVSMFGKKKRVEAANAFWSLGAIYEKQGDLDQVAKHYRAYLAQFADQGTDRAIVAWSKIGTALYTKACPVKLVDGSCVRVIRENVVSSVRARRASTEVPKQCGDESKVRVITVARDERDVRDAMVAFDKAIAMFDAGKGLTGDVTAARYYAALAKVGKIDRDYEKYLAMPIPSGLDFDTHKPAIAARSKTRFESWVKGKLALGGDLRKGYEAVIEMHDGATTITSAARLGQITQGFAGQLFRAEIPLDQRTGPYAEDTAQNYCDALNTLAEPLEADAIRSYQGCLATSTKLGWFSEYSRVCERELGQIQPDKYPAIAELRHQADQVSSIYDIEAPKLRPE